jgi:hypothetical protein
VGRFIKIRFDGDADAALHGGQAFLRAEFAYAVKCVHAQDGRGHSENHDDRCKACNSVHGSSPSRYGEANAEVNSLSKIDTEGRMGKFPWQPTPAKVNASKQLKLDAGLARSSFWRQNEIPK